MCIDRKWRCMRFWTGCLTYRHHTRKGRTIISVSINESQRSILVQLYDTILLQLSNTHAPRRIQLLGDWWFLHESCVVSKKNYELLARRVTRKQSVSTIELVADRVICLWRFYRNRKKCNHRPLNKEWAEEDMCATCVSSVRRLPNKWNTINSLNLGVCAQHSRLKHKMCIIHLLGGILWWCWDPKCTSKDNYVNSTK